MTEQPAGASDSEPEAHLQYRRDVAPAARAPFAAAGSRVKPRCPSLLKCYADSESESRGAARDACPMSQPE